MKRVVYVAGKLSDDTCGYIRNVSRMIKFAEQVRRKGFAVVIPALDLLTGITMGDMDYPDYYDNDQAILKRCDAMILTPGWEDSLGTQGEIMNAHRWDIPVFDDIDEMVAYFERPLIICIVGRSGAGKTTIAEYIEAEHGIKMIMSYTDRDRRHPEERGHTFISPVEFASLDRDEMIAYTEWTDEKSILRHYCCMKSDVVDRNTYVIDERGLCHLKREFGHVYNIVAIRIDRPEEYRIEDVGEERVKRDEGKYFLPDDAYDYIIRNSRDEKSMLFGLVDAIVQDIIS